MDPNTSTTNTEAELESFRQKWKEEVTARTKAKASPVSKAPALTAAASSSRSHVPKSNAPDAASHSHARQSSVEHGDDVTPHEYHDLGEKHHGRRLDETSAQAAAAASASKEPSSALDHYEKAVEKESQGSLGDSVNLYRKAFKLDSRVHESYKAKHFPPSFFKSKPQASQPPPSLAASAPKTQEHNSANLSGTTPLSALPSSLQTLINGFSSLSIQGEPPPTEFSPAPPCPISTLPEELLVEILENLATQDISSFVRLAQVCKRLAYLVATEDRVWKRLALGHEYGFAAMHYTFACQIDGKPLGDDGEGGHILDLDSDLETEEEQPSPIFLPPLLVPTLYPTYRALFQRRPRIRFTGCYISTVNYSRPGQSSPTSVSWNSPIHIVTYYRYLRFFRDGTCISLLTTSEPADVVPYLHIEHMHKNHGALPSAPMKDALLGRWRLTGGGNGGEEEEDEKEGTLVVETAGVTPKYLYKMMLNVGSAGRSAKNNKLSWQGYWSYNRLTDDWGEFGLKNDRPFFYSRVKSYGMAWVEGGMKT